jgi:hypothetical protein
MVEYSLLYEWTKEYFDGIGQEHDYSKLIEHFIQNKVFAYEGNSVYFRYNIFLSFFIAHQMLNSQQFRNWILTPPRYMTYINEVDIYCGLSRNDVDTLDLLAAEFAKYSKEMADLIEPLAWEDRLERLTLPPMDKKDQDAFVDSINQQLTSSTDKRDETIAKTEQQHSVKPALKRAEQMGLMTQFGRALSELNIEILCANASQAKGRVERAHHTLQDRLVKELRLAGISTIEAANGFLPAFVQTYNARFAKPPASERDLHRPIASTNDLDDILCWREQRSVSRQLVINYNRMKFMLRPNKHRRRWPAR